MTGSGIESDFVLPDSLSYRIIAHRQLSIRILAQTVVFFAQLACRRIHLRFFAPRTLPGALPLDSAKGSSTLWTPVCAIQLSAFSCYARVLIRERHQCRPKPPPNPFEFPTTVLLCVTVALLEPIVTVYVSPTTKSALENTTLFALFTVTPVYSTVP